MATYPFAPAQERLLLEKTSAVFAKFESVRDALSATEIPKILAGFIQNLQSHRQSFQEQIERLNEESPSLDIAVEAASRMAASGVAIALSLKKHPPLVAKVGARTLEEFESESSDLKKYCDSHAVTLDDNDKIEQKNRERLFISSRPDTERSEKLLSDVANAQARLEATERNLLTTEARISALSQTASEVLKRIDDTLAAQTTSIRNSLTAKTESIDKQLTDSISRVEKRADDFAAYEKKAEKILDAMGNKLLSDGYAGNAGKEERSANFFRLLSIILMAVTFCLLSSTLLEISRSPSEWKDAIVRVVTSLILAVPTAYMARESGKHRAQSIELRRTALDFLALNPFLAEVQKLDTRDALKAELAKRVFFNETKADSSSSFPLDTQALVMKALDIAQDAVKSKS